MKMLWTGRAGLAKAAAFFATVLVVSIGLCGVNFAAVVTVTSLAPMTGAGSDWRQIPMAGLTFTAYAETLGIIVGVAGFVVVATAGVVREIARFWKDR